MQVSPKRYLKIYFNFQNFLYIRIYTQNDSCLQSFQILLFLLPAVAFAAHPHHAPAHGYGHPKLYCRDTNTSVYAEVCVPQFAPTVTPETLAVKIVVPETFCYERVITTCVETNSVNTHTLCTSTYAAVEQKFPVEDPLAGHITQVRTYLFMLSRIWI